MAAKTDVELAVLEYETAKNLARAAACCRAVNKKGSQSWRVLYLIDARYHLRFAIQHRKNSLKRR